MTKMLLTPDDFDAYKKALDTQWDAAMKKADAAAERKAKRAAVRECPHWRKVKALALELR